MLIVLSIRINDSNTYEKEYIEIGLCLREKGCS